VKGAPKLPVNLIGALRAYDKNKVREWNSFVSHFSR